MATTGSATMRVWHFQCPACGVGDAEWGELAADEELFCEVCLSESRVSVRLCRWQADGELGEQEAGRSRAA
jgi:hypothetical protein